MQRSDLRPSESGWGGGHNGPRLGTGWAGLAGDGRTDRLGSRLRGCAPTPGRRRRKSGTAQGARYAGWPEFAGNSGSPHLFLWLTFDGHNAIPFSWIGLQRIPEVFFVLFFIHIRLFLSFQTVVSLVDRLLKPPESQPLRNTPALTR